MLLLLIVPETKTTQGTKTHPAHTTVYLDQGLGGGGGGMGEGGVAVVITVNAFVKKEKTSRENKKMISPNERPATSQLALINRQLITTQRF